jgi:hypothetical protein
VIEKFDRIPFLIIIGQGKKKPLVIFYFHFFSRCAIELSSVLKGYCQKNDGSLSRRIPLYSQLSILQEPILNAITKFVWKAREVKSQNSTNFLDMISDLSSVYLEHEILLTRHDLSSVRENQFYRVINQVESLFQNVFPGKK